MKIKLIIIFTLIVFLGLVGLLLSFLDVSEEKPLNDSIENYSLKIENLTKEIQTLNKEIKELSNKLNLTEEKIKQMEEQEKIRSSQINNELNPPGQEIGIKDINSLNNDSLKTNYLEELNDSLSNL